MYSMCSTPLISCSSGVATVAATGFGVGARILRPHDDGRRGDLRILGGGKLRVGDQADDEQHDRDDRSEDRPIDEEMREPHCGNPAVSAFGGRVTSSGFTLTPGLTRIRPLITMVSSPVRPSRMTR